MEIGHPARTSCRWGQTNWQTDGKVSRWEEVSQRKDFRWLGWLSLQIPEGCLVESRLNMSGPARHQGGEEMERTSPQRTDLALSVEPGCKIDGLTQGECLMDRTGLVTPALRLWGSPLVEPDPHLDLPLPGQESLARARGFKECVQPARLLRVVEDSPSGLSPWPKWGCLAGSGRLWWRQEVSSCAYFPASPQRSGHGIAGGRMSQANGWGFMTWWAQALPTELF